jgi:nitrogen fixation protein FixH
MRDSASTTFSGLVAENTTISAMSSGVRGSQPLDESVRIHLIAEGSERRGGGEKSYA